MSGEDKETATMLSRVVELVMGCPRFGDYEWCNDHCDLYDFCDKIAVGLKKHES